MKSFIPFLLVPVLGTAGWGLSVAVTQTAPAALPDVPVLAAPPALGVVIAGPAMPAANVPMEFLLPPASRKRPDGTPAVAPALPTVTAVLIDGTRSVAQVEGRPLSVGEHHGYFRVAAIESGRVLFEHPALREKRWIAISEK